MVKVGTSRAAKAPRTTKWNKVIDTLRSPERSAETVFGVTFSVAMNAMATLNPVSVPIFYGISEGLRFVIDVKERGLDAATKSEAIRISATWVVPSISAGLWDMASSKMDKDFLSSPFGRLAELAFKKTMNQIATKGVQALVKE